MKLLKKNKLPKKATSIIGNNAVKIIAVVFFAILLFLALQSYKNNAQVWEDFYAKETSKIINVAEPGDVIALDVSEVTEIASRNAIQRSQIAEIFSADNQRKEVCYKFSRGRKTCYAYFNNVNITNIELKPNAPVDLLTFEVTN